MALDISASYLLRTGTLTIAVPADKNTETHLSPRPTIHHLFRAGIFVPRNFHKANFYASAAISP
jgi:hypothetical protein